MALDPNLAAQLKAYLDNLREPIELVASLDEGPKSRELDELLVQLDPDVPFPKDAEGPRGRQGSPSKVALPDGWLDDPEDEFVPVGADIYNSGG